MPLFQRRQTIPLAGLTKSELSEADGYFECHGVTKDMATKHAEQTQARMQGLLENWVTSNVFRKAWIYYLLTTFYLAEGRIKEVVDLNSDAVVKFPSDPRPSYSLGTIYYGLFNAETAQTVLSRNDLASAPVEIRERLQRAHSFETQNSAFIKGLRESKLVASRWKQGRWHWNISGGR